MPGTRYSATFDRTYVEESPPAHSPVRFSIQSWQGASLPGNPPLNGSYKHHAQTASTDSLDSSGTGASSTSSGSGTGHFTQMSLDCPGDSYTSQKSVTKTAPVNKNAFQFVKVGPVPLFKKVVEQIQQSKEIKVAKSSNKEEEEQWQNNLDSWKSRRKKLSERAIQRVEDLKLLAQDEEQKPSRTRTFSEMMENRAQKPRGYNLSIYVENDDNGFLATESSESFKNPEDEMTTTFPDVQSHSQDDHFSTLSVQESSHKDQPAVASSSVVVGTASQSERDHVSSITVDYSCDIFPEGKPEAGNAGEVGQCSSNSKGSSVVCVEEDCNGCGMYTIDSGLESFSSSQRAGDIQDSSSELSVDSSGGFDRGVNEDEADGHSNIHQGEGRELNLSTISQSWSTEPDLKTGCVQLNLRLWLNSENRDKDFGFGVVEERGAFTVEGLKSKGPAWQGGLRSGDQILAVNGESTSGRSKSSITFAMKQSIYNGHLDLIISRSNNEDTKDSSVSEAVETGIPGSETTVATLKLNGHGIFDSDHADVSSQPSDDAFGGCSKRESLLSWEQQEHQEEVSVPLQKKKLPPPPIPAKPKLSVLSKTQYESDSHAPMVRTISNEMKLERMCAASEYMSLDGVGDISKEMRDAEDELDQEMVVYGGRESPGGEPADLVFCVEQDPVPVSSELRCTNNSTLDVSQGLQHPEREPSTQQSLVPLHHVKEENGLNIIFESHPSQNPEVLFKDETVSEVEMGVVQQSQAAPQQRVLQQQDVEHVLQSLVTEVEDALPHEGLLDSAQEVETESHNESQESEWVREELSVLCPEEPISCNSLLLTEQQSPVLHPDDQLLVDLASPALVMDPPKEKPPPPPPADSPEQIPKMNTFKRVKKDLWKRRSDFLGIDASGDEIDVDVPPPPDLSEILKSELDLERQNRLWLEKERFLSSSSCSSSGHERTSSVDSHATDEEIAQREKEIIDNLEKEEKARHALPSHPADENPMPADEQQTSAQSKEDERIVRLQDERRRMEEERFQREELRIQAEEDRIFKDREEQLRRQEEALELERVRLQRDQERLQKEREEYRRQMELEQRKNHETKDSRTPSDRQGSENVTPPSTLMSDRDAVIYASKRPEGLSEATSPNSNQNSDFNRSPQGLSAQSPDLASEGSQQQNGGSSSQQMNRNALHFLGAAPKARIIQSEQWISQQDTIASKRRSDPIIGMNRERGYNQNHWLVQEAEIRRVTEQNERQHGPPDHRRHSASASLRSQAPPPVTSPTVPGLAASNRLPRHISSTIPRPYQRLPPPPPPPPKPPHGMPLQGAQLEQPWNYRPVTSVGMAPRVVGNDKPYKGDLSKYRSESVLGIPTAWTKAPPPAESQPDHLLSVSGKERCSHCAEPLGCGGAMIIESLQLYYHMHCFSCCVCQAPLGNGSCGTDVRVRNQKLHCQNCYSNDEAGLKFSQV